MTLKEFIDVADIFLSIQVSDNIGYLLDRRKNSKAIKPIFDGRVYELLYADRLHNYDVVTVAPLMIDGDLGYYVLIDKMTKENEND